MKVGHRQSPHKHEGPGRQTGAFVFVGQPQMAYLSARVTTGEAGWGGHSPAPCAGYVGAKVGHRQSPQAKSPGHRAWAFCFVILTMTDSRGPGLPLPPLEFPVTAHT